MTEQPIVQQSGTAAAQAAAIGNGQVTIITDGTEAGTTFGFKWLNKLFKLPVAESGSGTLRDITGLTITANVGFAGDGSALTGVKQTQLADFGRVKYVAVSATRSTGAGEQVVEFTGSTASQVETMPAAAVLTNGMGRAITFKNSATVPWTIRQYAGNSLAGTTADMNLPVGATLRVLETGLNTWIEV